MDHYYNDIDGWFDFKNIYTRYIEAAPKEQSSIFVEVGTWLGKSTCFMGVEIINSQKPITLFAIDDFCGSPNEEKENGGLEPPMITFMKLHSKEEAISSFLKNIATIKQVTIPLLLNSAEAVKQFDNESIDFCFIDSDHSYGSISGEIDRWMPKMKRGGTIGGHDIGFAPVERAVREHFQRDWLEDGASWIHKV